jgi:cation transport regulator
MWSGEVAPCRADLPRICPQPVLQDRLLPYARNSELPLPVRSHLPAHAQDIYRSAFNAAWDEYGEKEPTRIEEIAHRVAWAAVKKRYRKAGDTWVTRARA